MFGEDGPVEMPPSNPYPHWDDDEARQLVTDVIDDISRGSIPTPKGAPLPTVLVECADEGMPPPLTEEVLARLREEERVVEVNEIRGGEIPEFKVRR